MYKNSQYFPGLNCTLLKSYARNWAKEYKIIRRISLHRCLDPKRFKTTYVKYVVVFEYDPKDEDCPEFTEFQERFPFDAGFDSLLDARFIDVYQKEPSALFRDEWDFWEKRLDERLPNDIDAEYNWQLFPQKEIASLNDEEIRTGEGEAFFIHKNVDWDVGYQKESGRLKDIKRTRCLAHIIKSGEKGIDFITLVNVIEGINPSINKSYSNMSEINRSNENLHLVKSSAIDENFSEHRNLKKMFKNRAIREEVEELKQELDELNNDKMKAEDNNDIGEMEKVNIAIEEKQQLLTNIGKEEYIPIRKRCHAIVRNHLRRVQDDLKKAGLIALGEHLNKSIDTKKSKASYIPLSCDKPDWHIIF